MPDNTGRQFTVPLLPRVSPLIRLQSGCWVHTQRIRRRRRSVKKEYVGRIFLFIVLFWKYYLACRCLFLLPVLNLWPWHNISVTQCLSDGLPNISDTIKGMLLAPLSVFYLHLFYSAILHFTSKNNPAAWSATVKLWVPTSFIIICFGCVAAVRHNNSLSSFSPPLLEQSQLLWFPLH